MHPKTVESLIFKENQASQRLLVAFAHPDDESFGPAGTIIRYSQAGAAVNYICGTRGEAGTVEPEWLTNYDSIAQLRTQELLCAAKPLGLTGLHFLNYHDSGMENSTENDNPDCLIQTPVEVVAEAITALIRQIKPQVILTFDASGGYFHPDHIHIHQATTLAFHAAGKPDAYPHQIEGGLTPYQPQKLYYNVFPRRFIRLIVRLMTIFGQDPTAIGRNKDVNLKRIADVNTPVTTKIDVSPYFDLITQAANCHASQLPGVTRRVPVFVQRWFSRYNTYTRIVPHFTAQMPTERDLFAGVLPD